VKITAEGRMQFCFSFRTVIEMTYLKSILVGIVAAAAAFGY
jgi:hypothetical protein